MNTKSIPSGGAHCKACSDDHLKVRFLLLVTIGACCLCSCVSRDSPGFYANNAPDSALLKELRTLTKEKGLVAAKSYLVPKLEERDGSKGLLLRRVEKTTADAAYTWTDSLAALPSEKRSRIGIAVVPGTKAAHPHGRDRTRETLRAAAERSREMGFSTWFVATEARGSVEENAERIDSQMQEVFSKSDQVILVMLSKGAHDVIRYLRDDCVQLPAAQRKKLRLVLSLAGTVQGSVVADWMAHSPRPFAASMRRWLRVSGQAEAVEMLDSISKSPWEGGFAADLSRLFPRLTWVSIAMVPDGADGRITARLWAPAVRRQIERTAPYYSPNDGLVESAASVLPDSATLPEWVVVGYGSHSMPNGKYPNGERIAPQTTRPGREKLQPESGGEIMSAYLRALPASLLDGF